MKRKASLLITIFAVSLLLSAFACNQSPQATARDVIASASGAIRNAQTQYHDSCVADKTQQPCVLINKAIAANNLAIDALEAYCSGPAFDAGTGPCVPNSALQPKLQAAVVNLNEILTQVNALKGGK